MTNKKLMSSTACSVSFIVPAFNEQLHIGNTLAAIRRAADVLNIAEVVVIDNCSTDRTAEIAVQYGVKLLSVAGGPVSRLRNIGVANSTGDVLVFLDADVSLTDDWYRWIHAALEETILNPMRVTGSHCLVPQGSVNLLEKYWFASFQHSASSHLGTGHLIMTRKVFDLVGGFSELLETGEDYDICARIIRAGGVVEEDARLRVVHNDFPHTFSAFIRREIWHGSGDSRSLSAVWQSKVAIGSLVFVGLHLLILVALVGGHLVVAAAGVAMLVLCLLLVSHRKFGRYGQKVVGINAFIYYLYFTGRSLALVRGLAGK